MNAFDGAREIAAKRDAAMTPEERRYWDWLHDAAVEDLRIIRKKK